MDERLLTTEEVAAYLRVSRATIWRWCQERKLPAFKIGSEWRISQRRLDELTAELMGDRRRASAADESALSSG